MRFPELPVYRGGKSRGTANTNIVFHAKRLLALKEDGLPIIQDPLSLAGITGEQLAGACRG